MDPDPGKLAAEASPETRHKSGPLECTGGNCQLCTKYLSACQS